MNKTDFFHPNDLGKVFIIYNHKEYHLNFGKMRRRLTIGVNYVAQTASPYIPLEAIKMSKLCRRDKKVIGFIVLSTGLIFFKLFLP